MARPRSCRARLQVTLGLVLLPCVFTCGEAPTQSSRIDVQNGTADTLHQRSIALLVRMRGIIARRVEGVIDAGTAHQQLGSAKDICYDSWEVGLCSDSSDSTTWRVDFPDSLENGRHEAEIKVYDVAGLAESLTLRFVTDVADVAYRLTPLFGPGTDSDALDVNGVGDVVGWANSPAGVRSAVVWRGGSLAILPTGGTARGSAAIALNDGGDIVGSVEDTVAGAYCIRGIRWSPGTWHFVGAGPTYCDQLVIDVNGSGAALIRRSSPRSTYETFAWIDVDGVLTALPGMYPNAVNDAGQIVGWRGLEDGSQLPYDLRGAPLPQARRTCTAGPHVVGNLASISNSGEIAGNFCGTAFITSSSRPQAVDLNPSFGWSRIVKVASDGTVLAFDERVGTALLWRAGRTLRVALTTPGWRIDRVASMNDAGVIVGHATEMSSGRTTAVALSPAK